MMSNQGKSCDNMAAGFAKVRASFNTEKKYLDALISYIPAKDHMLDVGCGSRFPMAHYFIHKGF